MKPLYLAALAATFLVLWTGVTYLQRPQPRPGIVAKRQNPTTTSKVREARCTIKRAVFVGTNSALLKVEKDRMVHYVVLDLPTGDPRMPDYQSNWLTATYGPAVPTVVGVFPTVEAAVAEAASLCTRN